MKKTGKWMLWTVSAMIWLGLSSCLKHDNTLGVQPHFNYVIQTSNGYIPQMRLQTNDVAQSAKLILAGKTFTFEKLNDYFLELPVNYYNTLDSIPTDYGDLTVVAADGRTTSGGVLFGATSKEIGTMNLLKFKYEPSANFLSIELADTVENASKYYLMVKEPLNSGYAGWAPISLDMKGEKGLSATLNLDKVIGGNGTYKFAIAAAYSTTAMINESQVIYVKKGEEAGFDNTGTPEE